MKTLFKAGRFLLGVIFLLLSSEVFSCVTCNSSLQQRLFNEEFILTLGMIACPFVFIAILIMYFHYRLK